MLTRLEQFALDRSAARREADDSVERIEAPDRAAEVDAVARKIRSCR